MSLERLGFHGTARFFGVREFARALSWARLASPGVLGGALASRKAAASRRTLRFEAPRTSAAIAECCARSRRR
jgi:hypothetical protein